MDEIPSVEATNVAEMANRLRVDQEVITAALSTRQTPSTDLLTQRRRNEIASRLKAGPNYKTEEYIFVHAMARQLEEGDNFDLELLYMPIRQMAHRYPKAPAHADAS